MGNLRIPYQQQNRSQLFAVQQQLSGMTWYKMNAVNWTNRDIIRRQAYLHCLGLIWSPELGCWLFSHLSRVRWFSRALAFRSLYYPWGKMGTTRSLCVSGKQSLLNSVYISEPIVLYGRKVTSTVGMKSSAPNANMNTCKADQIWISSKSSLLLLQVERENISKHDDFLREKLSIFVLQRDNKTKYNRMASRNYFTKKV